MAVLPITIFPNPLLKETSVTVREVNDEIRKLMNDMLDTMYSERGVGLAAVQVGVLKRVIVMDIDAEYESEECGGNHGHGHHHHHHYKVTNQNPLFLVNPEIINHSEESSIYYEGCLSFPELRADVTRPKKVKVKYLDQNGKEQLLEAEGLIATCVQHEIDHLNGITFIEHISKLKREVILKKLKKLNH